MEQNKSEFSEVVEEMSRFAGALAGAAVVASKKVMHYLNNLTIVETILEPPADETEKSDGKNKNAN